MFLTLTKVYFLSIPLPKKVENLSRQNQNGEKDVQNGEIVDLTEAKNQIVDLLRGKKEAIKIEEEKIVKMIDLLYSLGKDGPDSMLVNSVGWTVLHAAAQKNNLKVLETLMRHFTSARKKIVINTKDALTHRVVPWGGGGHRIPDPARREERRQGR